MENPINRRWAWTASAILSTAAATWPIATQSAFAVSLCSMVALNMIGAVSLHLIIRTGHISMGHAAFMGVGSYACVIAVMRAGVPPILGLGVGMLASALLAGLIGPVVLRLTGKYFVLVTFLLGEIVRNVFVQWIDVTGGSNGISSIPLLHPALTTPVSMYCVILAAAAVCVGLCALLMRSEIGRAIDSVREAANVAETSGVPVLKLKVWVFCFACSLAGLQGGLLAFYLNYIDPGSFGITTSMNFVIMNIIGGMYSLVGPLIGAVFLVGLPELLRGYVELQQVIFGIILIVVMASFTGGIVEIAARFRSMQVRRRATA